MSSLPWLPWLAACASPPTTAEVTTPQHADDAVAVREIEHAGVTFRVVSVDPTRVDLDLYGHTPDGSDVHRFAELDAWLDSQGRRLIAVTNAGIFMEDLRPLGLCVERGRLVRDVNRADGYGNFYLKPNGIFWLDAAGAHVAETAAYAPTGDVRLATQSGPLVLSDGQLHPSLRADSPNVLVRSGVCVDARGRVHLAISDATRFYELATLFRDALGCDDGLYLDGAISQLETRDHPVPDELEVAFGGLLAIHAPR